ncbi:hypothetical protein EDD21DRAFT_367008 [Dissophora ornata]|nr:hypothetical protein BGZ58_007443 [Dissophora ornata]KAI8604131.1 hypothetical protein EDD21DRAFT_367008 [Dissophora ornata]
MRISTFVPAVLALTLFSASQAAPALMKRERNNLDAVVNLIAKVHTKVVVDSCTTITTNVCADVDLALDLDANILGGLVKAKLDVEKIRLSARAELHGDIKAKVDANAKAIVITHITAAVRKVIVDICPIFETDCITKNAHDIVVRVNTDINILISQLWVTVKADLPAHIRARAKVIIREVEVNAALVNAKIKGRLLIASNIDVHIQTWTKVWAVLYAKVQLEADLRAL